MTTTASYLIVGNNCDIFGTGILIPLPRVHMQKAPE
jgi:hypothetical protein